MKRSTYKKILESCRAAKNVKRFSWNLTRTKTGKYTREIKNCGVCAFGACLLGTKAAGGVYEDAGALLGLSQDQISLFIDGFDGGAPPFEDDPFILAGNRLAKTLIREGVCGG